MPDARWLRVKDVFQAAWQRDPGLAPCSSTRHAETTRYCREADHKALMWEVGDLMRQWEMLQESQESLESAKA